MFRLLQRLTKNKTRFHPQGSFCLESSAEGLNLHWVRGMTSLSHFLLSLVARHTQLLISSCILSFSHVLPSFPVQTLKSLFMYSRSADCIFDCQNLFKNGRDRHAPAPTEFAVKKDIRISLVVWCLRLCTPHEGGTGSNHGRGTKTSHAAWCGHPKRY